MFAKFNLLLITISFLAVSNNITAHPAKTRKDIVLWYGDQPGGSLHLKSQIRTEPNHGHHGRGHQERGHHRKGRHESRQRIFEPVILKLKREILKQTQRQQRKRHGRGHGHGKKRSFELHEADLISVKIIAKSKRGRGTVSLLVGDKQTTPCPIEGWPQNFHRSETNTFYDIYLDNPNWDASGRWQLFFIGNIKILQVIITIEAPIKRGHGRHRDHDRHSGHGRGHGRGQHSRGHDRTPGLDYGWLDQRGGHGAGRNRHSDIPPHRLVRPVDRWQPLTRVQIVYGCNNYRVPANKRVSKLLIKFLSGNANITNIRFELTNGSLVPYSNINQSGLFGTRTSNNTYTYTVRDILFDTCYFQSGISQPLLEIKTSTR